MGWTLFTWSLLRAFNPRRADCTAIMNASSGLLDCHSPVQLPCHIAGSTTSNGCSFLLDSTLCMTQILLRSSTTSTEDDQLRGFQKYVTRTNDREVEKTRSRPLAFFIAARRRLDCDASALSSPFLLFLPFRLIIVYMKRFISLRSYYSLWVVVAGSMTFVIGSLLHFCLFVFTQSPLKFWTSYRVLRRF